MTTDDKLIAIIVGSIAAIAVTLIVAVAGYHLHQQNNLTKRRCLETGNLPADCGVHP